MKSIIRISALAAALAIGGATAVTAQQTTGQTQSGAAAKPAKPEPVQGQDPADLKMTKDVQAAIAADKTLSVDAKKVAVITAQGMVTLTGSVKTIAERQALENVVIKVAGANKVTDKVKIKSKK